MRLKPTKVFPFFCLLIGLSLISGIGRHDISLSRYHKFAQQPTFNCVGEIYHNKSFQQSCVLLDSTHILTSAHAFYLDSGSSYFDSLYIEESNRWIYGNLSEKQIIGPATEYSIKLDGKTYLIKNIFVHDSFQNQRLYRDSFGLHFSNLGHKFDIAVAELAAPVPEITPAILYENFDELNSHAIMGGYGVVEKANDYNKSLAFHRRRKTGGENTIDSIGGFMVGDLYGELFLDFDAPNSDCCNRFGSPIPLGLEYMINGGDCGSGLFIKHQGEYQLAGLCSSEDIPSDYFNYADIYGSYYGFTFTYLRIVAFNDWIQQHLD